MLKSTCRFLVISKESPLERIALSTYVRVMLFYVSDTNWRFPIQLQITLDISRGFTSTAV